MQVKEQMMGSNEEFVYHQCIICGHTHLPSIPENIGRYYDTKAYYSFKEERGIPKLVITKIRQSVKKIFIQLKLRRNFLFSSALEALLSADKINKTTSILDYGCGAGQFVKELNDLGFYNACGFDPFLPVVLQNQNKLHLTNDLKTFKNAGWDIITLNHVFEHLENPIEVLSSFNKLLNKDGKLILRFPIIDSFAFEKYKENWVQFDAPRHINLFTRKSIRIAVEKGGNFKILKEYDDSFHFQFTGSELYLKKLTLSPQHNSQLKRLLSFKTYQYHFQAKKLNSRQLGDQMVIILEKLAG